MRDAVLRAGLLPELSGSAGLSRSVWLFGTVWLFGLFRLSWRVRRLRGFPGVRRLCRGKGVAGSYGISQVRGLP
ncbi:hypothetical protein [Sphaerimonospora thailandensis]|uniref:hypothetical protein n=1 Tax=Sphaerimonospora thailandensis TaxID=795644 RepID=UPI001EF2131A|nr:hypothetical protein [Sphaerimonospora thailandensis]